MSGFTFPEAPRARQVWLITLADLALLLVGFFVFLQANQRIDRHALARGMRQGFGLATPASQPGATAAAPIPLAAAAMLDFTPGSATLPQSPASLIAWTREAAKDPRVTIRISGMADGTAADVDPTTGSGAVLAADRARAVAAALAGAHAVAPARMTILNAPEASARGRRAVMVTLGFGGPQ